MDPFELYGATKGPRRHRLGAIVLALRGADLLVTAALTMSEETARLFVLGSNDAIARIPGVLERADVVFDAATLREMDEWRRNLVASSAAIGAASRSVVCVRIAFSETPDP
ncbi:MAG: hypothetical protein U0169_27805 [Polyangiaceae bacterium]